MKNIFLLILSMLTLNVFCQYFPETTTYYSSSNNITMGEEEINFRMDKGYMNIFDNYYKSNSKYGPLKLKDTGFDESGSFYETYAPDIYDLENYVGVDMSFFKVNYDKKGGSVLSIVHLISNSRKKDPSIKYYFTESGFRIRQNN